MNLFARKRFSGLPILRYLEATVRKSDALFVRRLLRAVKGFWYRCSIRMWLRSLPNELLSIETLPILAGPGHLGFEGGVFNPGAVLRNGKILALAKGQTQHWIESSRDITKFCTGAPLLFLFSADSLKLEHSRTLEVAGFSKHRSSQLEDFRLFVWNEKLYSTCDVLLLNDFSSTASYSHTEQIVAELNITTHRLENFVRPNLDFRLNQMEKNWLFFEHEGELYLLYSFSPYVLLCCQGSEDFSFRTVIRTRIPMPPEWKKFGDLDLNLSTNPIVFDERHLLLFIHTHKALNHRTYVQWPVLIDRRTLLPSKISCRPVFKGGQARGRLPGIIYTSSVVAHNGGFIVFNGESDEYISCARLTYEELDDAMIPIKW